MNPRQPLDPTKMAQYMSAETANAIFGQKLSDDPAYVGNSRYGHTYAGARDALKRRYADDAWKALQEAETGSREETHAVQQLSDMVFGDNEVGAYIDALNGDVARMAAETATPPAMFLGTLMGKIKFFGVVSDKDTPMTATLELQANSGDLYATNPMPEIP